MISQCAAELNAWSEVKDGWRPLYGDVDQFGVAVEWHDFRTARSFDWGKSFHPRSLEFCLNLEGHGQVGATDKTSSDYTPGNCGYYAVGDEPLADPPVAKAAQILWYQAKALELMAHFLFAPKNPEFFCMRQKRVARERVERVKQVLARDLANPPALEMIGQEVGCSPFYLSRIFSREVGLTIPQYLRKLRMERAAELLRTGRYNVTEAATEVGYSSLSHFSKAFCETIGCCPVLYPAAKNVILDR